MKRFPYSFKTTIILSIILFAAFMAAVHLVYELIENRESTRTNLVAAASVSGKELSSTIEYLNRLGFREWIANLIRLKARNPDVSYIELLDERNDTVVRAGNGYIATEEAAALINEVRTTKRGTTLLSEDSRFIMAFYPVNMGLYDYDTGQTGVLIQRYGPVSWITGPVNESIKNSIPMGMSVIISSIFIWIFLNKTYSARAFELLEAARRMSDGDLSVRIETKGTDELAELSTAFNLMAERIERNTEELTRSKERFDLAIRAADEGIWERDLKSNEVFFSSRWKSMLGYKDDELLDRYEEWEKRLHPEDSKRVLETFGSYISGDIPRYEISFRLRHKDGTYRWILSRGILVRDRNGEPLHMTGTHLDITDVKKTEETNLALQARMLNEQKTESLGILAGGIAHDFNNMLTAIMGNAEMCMSILPTSSPAQPHLEAIGKTVKKASALAGQILAYSGRGKFVVQNIDIGDLISDTKDMIRSAINKNIGIKYSIADTLPQVEADPVQITQVIMNLMINASEAIGKKRGSITVTTGMMNCSRSYLSWSETGKDLPEGDYIFIDVADTGCGMDEDVKARIFDPFFTTKFSGRGLGLASVYGIVTSHKGAIKIYSRAGEGTTFRVLLPPAEKQVILMERPASPAAIEKKKDAACTLLLVDDEEDIIGITRQILEKNGYCVLTAGDGESAVKLFKANSKEISAVVLDLMMPKMNGDAAFFKMKKIRKDIKVLLVSGYAEEEVMKRFGQNGFAGFIQKPYSNSVLLGKIREITA